MDLVIAYALQFVGTKYHWSGDDPLGGYDCSGFVLEILKAFGVLPHSLPKQSAQMIYLLITENMHSVNCWMPGALAFYGKSLTEITHIGLCLNQHSMIESGGGGADTTNEEVAIQRNAFVRIRPIRYRKDFLLVIRPSYSTIGVI